MMLRVVYLQHLQGVQVLLLRQQVRLAFLLIHEVQICRNLQVIQVQMEILQQTLVAQHILEPDQRALLA